MSLHVASPVKFAFAVAAATLALTVSSNACARDDVSAFVAGTLTATKDNLRAMPPEVLKSDYLMCERAAAQAMLDYATVIACSMLYEELHQRVFGGSFDALLSWWRENNAVDAATR